MAAGRLCPGRVVPISNRQFRLLSVGARSRSAYFDRPMRPGHLLPLKWLTLIREADLAPGTVQVRMVLWHRVGVVKVRDQIYVFEGSCPHTGRSLQGGAATCQGIIECPWHGLRLSLGSQPFPANAMPLTQLTFRVRKGTVAIDRTALRRRSRSKLGQAS